MLNHLKWYGSCYLKWQSVRGKRKWPISLLMWHSNKTEWAQRTGQGCWWWFCTVIHNTRAVIREKMSPSSHRDCKAGIAFSHGAQLVCESENAWICSRCYLSLIQWQGCCAAHGGTAIARAHGLSREHPPCDIHYPRCFLSLSINITWSHAHKTAVKRSLNTSGKETIKQQNSTLKTHLRNLDHESELIFFLF